MESGRVSATHVLNEKIQNPRVVGRSTCACTIICESKTHFISKNTRQVNPSNAAGFLDNAFSVEKKTRYMGVIGRITCKFTITLNARCIFIEKSHGIWKGFRDACFTWKKIGKSRAVGRVPYAFTNTLNTRHIYLRKQNESEDLVRHAFALKNTRRCRGRSSVTCKFRVKMKSRRNLYTVYTTISPGLVADWGRAGY